MKYKCVPISEPDQAIILGDLHPFIQQDGRLGTLSLDIGMPKRWTIDHEQHAYLFGIPYIARPESLREYYCFFFKEAAYVFFTESPFSDLLLQEADEGTSAISDLVKANVLAAFAVHGRFGLAVPDGFLPYFSAR